MSFLVDSHCHLTLLEQPIEDVLVKAREHEVGHMLCVSIDLEGLPQVISLAKQHPEISASAGIHPNTDVRHEPTAEQLAELAMSEEVVAVGETGLDYYRQSGDLEWQRQRFRNHIRAARSVNKPLIIHSRNASTDLLKILKEEGAEKAGGVMHCFVEDWDTAKQAMDMNLYISYSGIVTFKNASRVQEVARQIPLNRLLVETDAPYLAPVPYRGKTNQPAYVRYTVEYLARLCNERYEDLAKSTTENYFNLFPLAG